MASHPAFPGISRLALAVALAAALSACATDRNDVTGSVPSAGQSSGDWRQRAASLAERYRAEPDNAEVTIAYARALRETGQSAQAAAVLQTASIKNPKDKT